MRDVVFRWVVSVYSFFFGGGVQLELHLLRIGFFLFFLSEVLPSISFDWWLLNVVFSWVVWMCSFFFDDVFLAFNGGVSSKVISLSFFSMKMTCRSVVVLVLVSSVRI